MESSIKPKSAINNKSSRFAKKIQKAIGLRGATKIGTNNGIGICILNPQNRFGDEDYNTTLCIKRSGNHNHSENKHGDPKFKQRAVMEAVLAKLFAGITSIKAAYAELQLAQSPYNSDAIQAADQAIVDELKAISELKRSFLKKELGHLSPQVTIMLAEIQEQQSMMKTYEITIKKMEAEAEAKALQLFSLKKQLDEFTAFNKSLEKKLNSSGVIPILENIDLKSLNLSHFSLFLHYTLRSVRSFSKLMVREMESAQWDLEAATKVIEPEAVLPKPSHRYFVFQSFVCKTMLEGFNFPGFSSLNQSLSPEQYFNEFKKLKSINIRHFLAQRPNSSFAKFMRGKYLNLIHAKMECSLFGNLNQRKMMISGEFPESGFFASFAEMARRVWALHCLGFAYGEEVGVFQARKKSRFSEVYMENVSDEESLFSGEILDVGVDVRVNFTVVPGFNIGKNVIQSQVYLTPVVKLDRT